MPKNTKENNRIIIEGELTIYTVSELKDKLIAGLLTNEELEVDLSAVDEFDGAGLQLLVAMKQGAKALNRTLRLTGHSQAVLTLLALSGLESFFGDPLLSVQPKNEEEMA